MARRKRPIVQVGIPIGVSPELRNKRTPFPHRPLRWCYGLPLTRDPRNFVPDPYASSLAQIEAWGKACAAMESENRFRRPLTVHGVGYEPWGLGVTIFPESRGWDERWFKGTAIPGSEEE